MGEEDCPLVAANDRFLSITGYNRDEIIGRNCRFLQPKEGAGPVRKRMHTFLYSEGPKDEQFIVPNVRKDGTEFVNLVYMSKLVKDGETSFVLASQFDISRATAASATKYAELLTRDVRTLHDVLNPSQYDIMASYPIMANTTALIARVRLDY